MLWLLSINWFEPAPPAGPGNTVIVFSGPGIQLYMYSAWMPRVGETLNVAPIPPFQPVSKASLRPLSGISTPAPKLIPTGLSWAWADPATVRNPTTKTAASPARIEHTPSQQQFRRLHAWRSQPTSGVQHREC